MATAMMLCISLGAPVIQVAAQEVASPAVTVAIANTGGDGAILRSDPSSDASSVTTLAEGTEVTILDGPVFDNDGNSWLHVTADGSSGYVASQFVGSGGSDEASTTSNTDTSSDQADATSTDVPTQEATDVPTDAPTEATSDTPIATGVVVDNADYGALPADGIAVRDEADVQGNVLGRLQIGDSVKITGDETWNGDTGFYPIVYNDATGYVIANYISLGDTSAAPTTEATDVAPTDVATDAPTTAAPTETGTADAPQAPAWANPVDEGTVVDDPDFGALPSIGLAVRVAPSRDAAELGRLQIGDRVEVTGPAVSGGGTTFIPVNYGDGGGYVIANYIDLDSATSPTDVPATDVPATDVPTDVPATDVPTDVPATDVPATDAPTDVPATDVPTEAQATDVPATLAPTDVPATDVPTEAQATDVPATEAATDVPATNGPTDAPATDVPTNAPATDAPATTVPTDVPATQAPATDVPVTTAPATTAPQTAAPTDVPATDAPATSGPTEVPATNAPTNAPATDQATTAPTNAPATKTPTTAPATTAPTQTHEPAANVSATKAPTQAPSTSAPTTAPVTVAPTDAPATDAPAAKTPATVAPTAVPAKATAPASSIPADAQSIGSATVTGSNGDGIRCRVQPSTSADTITVLPEGTKVLVYKVVDGGWLQIGCGGQLGYGDVNYLWSGGLSDDQINAGGQLVVSGSGGGLNCRTGASTSTSIITVLQDGTVLQVRGKAANGWTPVTCAGKSGYVASDWVGLSSVNSADTGSSGGAGTVKVSGTNGDGVRCRTMASTSGAIITVLAEGTTVTTRGASANGWTPVTCGGVSGFISSTYLSASSSGSTPTSGGSASKVTVSGSGGGLNCRTGGSLSASIITVLAEGATVATRGATSNGWVPVVCGGKNGYVSSTYVKAASSSTSGGSGSGGSTATGTAKVSGTNGDGVRCRASASTSAAIITVLPEGTTVTLTGQANGGWQPVTCGGQKGYVSSQYLTLSSGGGSSSTTPTPAPSGDALAKGDHAKATSDVNLRYQASTGSGIALVVQLGVVVQITGPSVNGFYPINYDGLTGYMSGSYLSKTTAALSQRGGSGSPTSGGSTTPTPAPTQKPASGGTSTGNAIVNFAMGYLGYPYVYATHGPASFDCSGFTYWVILNVLGKNIGTGTWTQVSAGTPVSRSNLQPGDLVFFQNTYEAGLSHVGIYIGNNQFIHAENEDTGVRISDLTSDYYSSRWYGAVRIS